MVEFFGVELWGVLAEELVFWPLTFQEKETFLVLLVPLRWILCTFWVEVQFYVANTHKNCKETL